MDNLKQINDKYGHSAGDDALRRIATALTGIAGLYDNIAFARTGGDEFCAIFRIARANEGVEFVVRLREELKKINERSGQPYNAEISCGVYEVKDTAKVSLLRALEMSDERMYEDKRQRKAFRKA